jgi:hypothetical protein
MKHNYQVCICDVSYSLSALGSARDYSPSRSLVLVPSLSCRSSGTLDPSRDAQTRTTACYMMTKMRCLLVVTDIPSAYFHGYIELLAMLCGLVDLHI